MKNIEGRAGRRSSEARQLIGAIYSKRTGGRETRKTLCLDRQSVAPSQGGAGHASRVGENSRWLSCGPTTSSARLAQRRSLSRPSTGPCGHSSQLHHPPCGPTPARLQGTVSTEGSSSPPPFFTLFLYFFSLNVPSTAAPSVPSTSRGRFLLYHSFGPGCSSFLIDNLTLPSKAPRNTTPWSPSIARSPNQHPDDPLPETSPSLPRPNDGNRYSFQYIFNSKKGRALEGRILFHGSYQPSALRDHRRNARNRGIHHPEESPGHSIPQPKVIRRPSAFAEAAAAHLQDDDNVPCSTLLIRLQSAFGRAAAPTDYPSRRRKRIIRSPTPKDSVGSKR